MTADNSHNAVGILVYTAVGVLLVAVKFPWVGMGWITFGVTHLLSFEWKANPERYGWFGQNPYLATVMIQGFILLLLFVYAIVSLIHLLN